jgi:hypothetical protein
MSINCGHCGNKHDSVGAVRDCYEGIGTVLAPAEPAATEPQVAFCQDLFRTREPLPDWADVEPQKGQERINDFTKKQAHEFIDRMKPQPWRKKVQNKIDDVTEGMYKLPDGDIYKVQVAVHGSGQLYAKKLEIETFTDVDGEEKKEGKFVYQPNGMRRLRPEYKMSLEEAKKYGSLYGICCVCGRTLTNEESIADGIGPICGGKEWWN